MDGEIAEVLLELERTIPSTGSGVHTCTPNSLSFGIQSDASSEISESDEALLLGCGADASSEISESDETLLLGCDADQLRRQAIALGEKMEDTNQQWLQVLQALKAVREESFLARHHWAAY